MSTSDDTPRARVFISCGRNKQSDEVEIARQIEDTLKGLGFNPYIAVEQQSLLGLKEAIFSQLERSEYFVFVDFKRERLGAEETHRGSLFAHQELAVASFLEIPVIALQEDGIKSDDGILQALHTNAMPFSDRRRVAAMVAEQTH